MRAKRGCGWLGWRELLKRDKSRGSGVTGMEFTWRKETKRKTNSTQGLPNPTQGIGDIPGETPTPHEAVPSHWWKHLGRTSWWFHENSKGSDPNPVQDKETRKIKSHFCQQSLTAVSSLWDWNGAGWQHPIPFIQNSRFFGGTGEWQPDLLEWDKCNSHWENFSASLSSQKIQEISNLGLWAAKKESSSVSDGKSQGKKIK